jgi:hypothetical protein
MARAAPSITGGAAAATWFPDTSLEELHRFAESLGLRREWFQEKSIPHYDLTGKVYDLALERGAKLVSSREIVRRAVRLEGRPKMRPRRGAAGT